MKNYLAVICTLFLLAFAGALCAGDDPGVPVRGVWIIRFQMTRPEKIDRFLEKAGRLGITDLFVQIRGRGDAYYASRYEPRAETLSDHFDPLEYLLNHPLRKNFRVHAWINTFYVWSKPGQPRFRDHLILRRPDWLARPFHGPVDPQDTLYLNQIRSREGIFLSPLLPGVQRHILNVVTDILSRYPVDGLHLDYIRYPGPDFDFHPYLRRQFRNRYLIDPLDFKSNPEQFLRQYTRAGYDYYSFCWGKFLQDGLSRFVQRLSQRVRHRFPGVLLTAAVKADLAQAHWKYYQSWERWVKNGWLDYVVPMNYTANNLTFVQRIRVMLQEVSPDRIVMGVSLYNQTPAQVAEKIRLVQEIGLKGATLFSYDQVEENTGLERYIRREWDRSGPAKSLRMALPVQPSQP